MLMRTGLERVLLYLNNGVVGVIGPSRFDGPNRLKLAYLLPVFSFEA